MLSHCEILSWFYDWTVAKSHELSRSQNKTGALLMFRIKIMSEVYALTVVNDLSKCLSKWIDNPLSMTAEMFLREPRGWKETRHSWRLLPPPDGNQGFSTHQGLSIFFYAELSAIGLEQTNIPPDPHRHITIPSTFMGVVLLALNPVYVPDYIAPVHWPRAYQGDMTGNMRGWSGFIAPG